MPIREGRGDARALARKIAEIGSDGGRRSLSEAVGGALLHQVDRQFASSTDPYGTPWPPLAHGGADPLEGTGKLRRTFRVVVDARGVRLETPLGVIVRAHAEGATIPPRQAAARELVSARSGRFITAARAQRRKLVYVSTAREHRVDEIRLPKRQIVPDHSRGVGPTWGGAMNQAAREWMSRKLDRR